MLLHITEPYLWFPVGKGEPEVKLHLYLDGEKFQEIDIRLGGADKDLYTAMYVGAYLGKDVEIRGDVREELLEGIVCHKDRVQDAYPFRPQLHFSPKIGWNNDPNGLVYADGLYHLYYQWNPYDLCWGNMHWGHAVSKDLLTWEHRPPAIRPDVYGPAYSGCGWVDREGVAGYGKDALLFYYTAAGGRDQWSAEAGHQFTQRLRVSTDGGDTLELSDQFLIGHVAGEDRDPKVLYHKESDAYILLLYLEGYGSAVYRSKNLLDWKEASRFRVKDMWECPNLFRLPVEELKSPGGEDGAKGASESRGHEERWVFWSADGYYMVGDFDGYTFVPQTSVLMAYSTKLPYAAQTYAGVKDRVISVAWLRMENDRGNYRGLMSLPAEVSLVKMGKDYRLRLWPVRELAAWRQLDKKLGKGQKYTKIRLGGAPLEVDLAWDPQEKGRTKLCLANYEIIIDYPRETISFYELEKRRDMAAIFFRRTEALTLKLIIDQEVIEFYGNGGLIYGAVEMTENVLQKTLTMTSNMELKSMCWRSLSPNGGPKST